MDSIHLISSFFAMVVFAAIRGPGVLAMVSRTLRKGESSAMFLVFGLLLGDILYASFAVFGLDAVAHHGNDFFLGEVDQRDLSDLPWLSGNHP